MKYRFGFLTGAAVGYVLGTHAGRERYDEVLRWARSLPDRMRSTTDDVTNQVDVGASKLENQAEQKMAEADMASRRTAKVPNTVRS